MKRILLLAPLLLGFIVSTNAQNVFNPNDPIVRYSSSAAYGSAQKPDSNIVGLQKWVANITNGVSTGSGSFRDLSETFKAYFMNYYNTRLTFRVKFPRSYSNPDSVNKKYPVALFLHGAGEVACASNGGIYNNEKQLVLGGQLFGQRVDNNQFDGFLVYPQLRSRDNGCWGEWTSVLDNANFRTIMTFLDSMNKYVRSDIDRVFVFGLSGGGTGSWKISESYPGRFAAMAPTSSAGLPSNWPTFVHIPVWLATGGKDGNPSPAMALYSETQYNNAGGVMRRSLYEDLGHSSWDRHWREADFVPFMLAAHKANPLIFFNRFEYCPGDAINSRIGISAGFYAYEWRKDEAVIARRTGSTNTVLDNASVISFAGNELNVRAFGAYSVRFQRVNGGAWSEWSPRPAVIRPKPITQTPPIQTVGLQSKVLPAPDGATRVQLQLPANFINYQWVRVSDNATVSTAQIYEAGIGTYKAKYAEPNGCGTEFSPEYKVVSATGSPKPDAAKNLSVSALSQTALSLNWSDNPNASVNETGFEIYRATKAGGPYTLVKVTAPDVITYQDTGLVPNANYFYIVRAVNETGAAALSNESSGKTEIDNIAPTAPVDLEYRGSTSTSVSLRWGASTDNSGVSRYDIYANGQKLYSTTNLWFAVANLDSLTMYTFVVKAVDRAGNESPASNQVMGFTHRQGLNYRYYHGSYSNLPNFTTLTPVIKSGVTDTVNAGAGIRTQNDNFALIWESNIYIPESGTYTFETYSDDGSRLYIDVPYSFNATSLVNNDGAHGAQFRTGTKYLAKGYHSIVVTYAEVGGDEVMDLWWSNNVGLARERIPKNFFALTDNAVSGPSAAPSFFVATAASYNAVDLKWTDNSGDETGFEIVRATAFAGPYTSIATTAPNVTTYRDSGLTSGTRYFYRIRSINGSGSSPYVYTEAAWRLNNSFADENGHGTAYNLTNSGTSYNTDRIEGSHAVSITGTNYLTFNSASGFPSLGGYSQRTVAMWLKPSNNTGKRMVFEIGDATNGLGLRLNNGALEARIAGAGSGATITLGSFATNANWTTNAWNHVAVVYDRNSLYLYLNGVQVASTGNLSFAAVENSTNASRIGNASGTNANNVFNDGSYSNYLGLIDYVAVLRGALSQADVAFLRNNPAGSLVSSAATLSAPAAPAVPTGLAANVLSTSSIELKFNDNSSSETGFEIWRSSGDKSNNRRIATLPANSGSQVTYLDSTLFANITYYYTVRATGVVANSAFSAEVSGRTLNTKPVIEKIRDFSMRYATTYVLPVSATDEDGEVLTFSTANLPTFATIDNVQNGLLNISFNPSAARRGTYTITVNVTDGNGGSDTTKFRLLVDNNDVPVLSPINDNIALDEGTQTIISLSATDNNGTTRMAWEFEGLPSFATFADNNNGTGTILVKPGYSAAGEYNVRITVYDGYGAWTSRSTVITVMDKEPEETVQLDFRSTSAQVALWNSIDVASGTISHGTLYNIKSAPTTMSLSVSNTYVSITNQVNTTGNNSGVFPDNVIRDAMRWGFFTGNHSQDTLIMKVSGLDPAKTYDFTFHGSYAANGDANSVTSFRIGTTTVTYNYLNNSTQSRTITGAQPNAAGEITIYGIGDPHPDRGGVISGMIVKANFDDGSVPAKPGNLTATTQENQGVVLNWVDNAFNEQAYRVYRSTNRSGSYTVLNPSANNRDTTSYTDNGAAPFTVYYYYVAGVNAAGTGISSDTIKVTTGNNKPVITSPANVLIKTDATQNFDFSVTDDPGDVVTVSLENKPSFVTLQTLGGANYRIAIAPTVDHIGWFNLTISATDDKGGVSIKAIPVTVSDKNTRSVYINMGNASIVAPAPWNNFTGTKTGGNNMQGLRDETNTATPFAITTVTPWNQINNLGHITGNNSGVLPDNILQTGVWDNGSNPSSLTFSGLNNAKRYNIVIIGSMNEGANAGNLCASGTITDTLITRYNTRETANLNGLTPSNGSINFTIARMFNTIKYVNAIILEEYEPTLAILNPINLYAEAFDRNAINLTWSDRTRDEATVGGYVLERATDSLFAQNLVSFNLPANSSSYRSTGLSPNVRYWYRLRARTTGGVFSDYSNRAKAITPASIVYVNFNYTLDNAAYPWNNLYSSPTSEGYFDNLTNQSGAPSGLSLELVRLFNGEFTAGVNTGNNSGMVPDNALAPNFWLDKTQLSQFRLSGLSHARKYRIGFWGSASNVGWMKGDYTATYTVNGKTVYLNSWLNSTKIVYIDDVVPDASGSVNLDFSTTEEAMYAFNGGVIIQDYTDPDAVNNLNFNNATVATNAAISAADESVAASEAARLAGHANGRMYPNPFVDFINMDFHNSAAGNNVSVEVYDLSGRLGYRKLFGKLPTGNNTLRISANDAGMGSGVYIMTLSVNGKPLQSNKVIRTRD